VKNVTDFKRLVTGDWMKNSRGIGSSPPDSNSWKQEFWRLNKEQKMPAHWPAFLDFT
jgi:hypothetical protein